MMSLIYFRRHILHIFGLNLKTSELQNCLCLGRLFSGALLSNRELPLWIGGSMEQSSAVANFTGRKVNEVLINNQDQ